MSNIITPEIEFNERAGTPTGFADELVGHLFVTFNDDESLIAVSLVENCPSHTSTHTLAIYEPNPNKEIP